jgi:hypothetical protein
MAWDAVSAERTPGEVATLVGGDAKKLKLVVIDDMVWRPEEDGMWRPFPEDRPRP